MSDENELYWAAGFLEGEGCFHSPTTRYGSFAITCSQTETREPLDRLQQLFGGSIHLADKSSVRAKGSSTRDCFVWALSGPTAVKAAGQLLPLMSQRRQSQIINQLARYVVAHDGPSRGDNRKDI